MVTRKKVPEKVEGGSIEREKEAVKRLNSITAEVYEYLSKTMIPQMSVPLRTKGNIVFDERARVWKYGDAVSSRSAKSLDGAYMLLRTMCTIDFINEMVKVKKSSTLRELYYISESWGIGKFHSEDESNKLIEDLEITTRLMREDFKLRPEENGASIIGNITIEETVRTGATRIINCRDDVGDAGYGIPYNVEREKIRFKSHDAKFVIGIECGGMFDRLAENRFDEKYDAILVHLKGQPARCTRRLIKRLNEELNLPVVIFTDGDPWSFRIFASVAYGAIKTAHISEYLATPEAQFLGVTPSDIQNYDLPSDKLSDKDIAALQAELTDPRFNDPWWQGEIKLQLQMGRKAEQQSLAKYGLDFVTDTYLPEKLKNMGII
ncbi:MAG: DNA topoisomerase IV subunit A [Thermoplasmata archaeon]